MNDYEKKQADKKAYYLERAAQLRQEADSCHNQASSMQEAIPFGQPILIGHHSESRDRNYRARIGRKIDRAIELSKKAQYYEDKAISQYRAISSHDPDAIKKLKAKLEKLSAYQEMMKSTNKLFKKEGERCLEALSAADRAEALSNRRCWRGGAPFPSYCLRNNNHEMRRIKLRIKSLEAVQDRPVRDDFEGSGFTLKEDKEDNRILFVFDDKPDIEIRSILKRFGFRWSPRRGAWARMLNASGQYAADSVIRMLKSAS